MLGILSAVLGFASPFLPEVMKYFQRKQDNQHELEMMSLQAQLQEKQLAWKMEEIVTQGDIAEAVELHKPVTSFGVQMLDAAKGGSLSGWALYPAFYLFSFLDFVSGMVRPVVTYAAFAFYVSYKWAQLSIVRAATTDVMQAVLQVWSEDDRAIVILILSYWFGQRAAKAAFGGSASTISKGA